MVDLSSTITSIILIVSVSFALNYISDGNFLSLFDWMMINCSILTYAELLPFFIFIMFLILDATLSVYDIFSSTKSSIEVD